MRFATLFCVVLLVGLACSAAMAEDYPSRTWTNDQGDTLTATLKRVAGSTAYLDDNGKEIPAPISRLSDEDKEWIKKVRELGRWREWTKLDGSIQRAKMESLDGNTLEVSTRESQTSLTWSLDELSDADRQLIDEVYGSGDDSSEESGVGEGLMAGGTPDLSDKIGTVRTWTDASGKRISAEFRGLEGSNVVLYFKDKEWRVPMAQFSAADRQWVTQPTNLPNNPGGDRLASNDRPGMLPTNPDGRFPQFNPNAGMTAGGNQFDPVRNEIAGRMNPGAQPMDQDPYEDNFANNAAAEAQRRAEAEVEAARLEQERIARMQEEPPVDDFSEPETVAQTSSSSDYQDEGDLYGDYDDGFDEDFSAASYGSDSYDEADGLNAFGVLIVFAGLLISMVGGVWTLVVAAQESMVWLLACLFVPLAGLVFVITHWDEAGKPFMIQIGGTGLMFFGIFVGAL